MARRKPFDEYRQTTKEERIIQRKKLSRMVKTQKFKRWSTWIARMQHYECYYCDIKIDLEDRKSYHIEHRIPVYYGGKSRYNNLCLACPSCNITKSTDQLVRNKAHLNRLNKRREEKGTKTVIYL